MTTQQEPAMGVSVDWLANVIRTVDGNHSLGAGALAEKIVEALAALPHMQPAGEAVAWKCEWIEDGEVTWAQFHDASNPMPEKWDCPPDRITAYTTPPQPSAEEAPLMKCICTAEGAGCTNRCDRGQLPPIPAERITIPQQEAPGAVAWRDPAPHAAAPQPTPSTTLNVTTPPAPVDVRGLRALADTFVPDDDNGEEETEFDRGYEQALQECREQLNGFIDAQQPSADAGDVAAVCRMHAADEAYGCGFYDDPAWLDAYEETAAIAAQREAGSA